MSIDDWIADLIAEKRLHLVEPPFEGDPVERTLLVSPEIWSLINGPWFGAEAEKRCNRLRADLEAFVMGGSTAVCPIPYEAEEAFLGFLDSPTCSVWDIRAREPTPGIRLLGQFVEYNKFVALVPASRSVNVPYIARGPLGYGRSKEWKDAIRDTEHLFRSLFGPNDPVKGDAVHAILKQPYTVEGIE
jgi:hypothetical protein